MAMNINKSWSSAIVLLTFLLLVGLCPAVPAQPPGPQMSDEERQNMLDRLEQMRDQIEQGGDMPFPSGGMPQRGNRNFQGMQGTQQQRGNRNFQGFPNQTQTNQESQSTTPAQQMNVQPLEDDKVTLQLKDLDLAAFIQQVAELLGMTPIIIDSNVQGTVTMYTSVPMSKADLLPLFALILKQKNAALVEQDGIYQVIPITSGLKTGLDLIEHNPPEVIEHNPPEVEEQSAPAGQSLPTQQDNQPNSPAPEAPATGQLPRMQQNQPGSFASGTSPGGQFLLAQQNNQPGFPAPGNPPAGQLPQMQQNDQAGSPADEQGNSEVPRLTTHVIRIEFVPARDLVEPIRLLMSDGGVIMPYDRLNMLILTDYSDSIDRILKIIHLLDSRYLDENLIDLVKIENNLSADIVVDLEKLFGSGTENAASGVSFVSLDRMNSIFVMANSQRSLTTVKKWIERLDTTTGRNIQTYVYIVQNSTAANIAMLLSALYSEGETTQQGTTGTRQTTGTGTSGLSQFGTNNQTTGGISTTQQQRGSFGSFSSDTGTSGLSSTSGFTSSGISSGGRSSLNTGGGQLGPQFTSSQGISSMIIQGGEFSGLQETVRLVVDDISNRIIIQSTAADYAFMLETIEKMDVMPRQVIIDARVFEVDLTDDLSFGVGAVLRERTGGSTTVVGINAAESDGSITGALGGYNIALVGSSQELLTAMNALREKTNVKVLEAPSVLAMDGTEARITVGGEVPYAGSIYYQELNTAQSVNYRDTGVSLYVRPRISASGSVTMEVLQEVSGVGAVSSDLGPTFTKSMVETTLTVKDGETVAIAGLIRDNQSSTRTGFPLISDIPIIGSLFGQTANSKNRTELIIMITPHVIDSPDKHKELTNELKNSLKNVRKFADEKDLERIGNLQDAIIDREKQKQEQLEEQEKEQKKEERAKQRKRS